MKYHGMCLQFQLHREAEAEGSLVPKNLRTAWENILRPPISKNKIGRVPVAHACNPSYSGGRDQEDGGSKPSEASSLQDPISKIPFTKIGLVEWLKVQALSSSPSTAKINK
jgi:hypothetical protein